MSGLTQWRLYLRGRRLVSFALACAATLCLSLVVPTRIDVVLRSVSADPWQVLWCLPACAVAMCLDSSLDYMEDALPSAASLRRGVVIAVATAGYIVAVGLGGLLRDRDPRAAISGALLLLAVVLALAVTLGRVLAGALGFGVLLVSWVFGLADVGAAPRPWALLMQPFSPVLSGLSVLALLGSAAVWAVTGSGASRRPRSRIG